jgi:ADP-ribose pyrophosphatase YjhB (NUDIX family)
VTGTDRPREIRLVALGVPWRDGADGRELLVERYDAEGGFYRPLGGGVGFGEASDRAVVREFREETGYATTVTGRLGVVENVFRFDGDRHHELGVVYELVFESDAPYASERIEVTESDGSTRPATWHRPETLRERPEPVYPTGLWRLLGGDTDHVVAGTGRR